MLPCLPQACALLRARPIMRGVSRPTGRRRWLGVASTLALTLVLGAGMPVGPGVAQAEGGEGLAQPVGVVPAGEVHRVYPNQAVGTLGGSVAVGAGGGLSWSTSLQVVAGVNGLQPGLSIAYTGGGYGGLGVGFSLSAGGAISRCRDTLGQDGAHQQIDWSVADALCLDGARLVVESGPQGADGTQYRLQNAPTVRVVAHEASTSATSSFTVYTPDGRVAQYGLAQAPYNATQWARRNGSLVPLAWHLAMVTDASHNYLRYAYTGEAVAGDGVLTPADHRLTSIGYGGNPLAGLADSRLVNFTYTPVQSLLGALPKDEDVASAATIAQGYVAGMAQQRTQVLTEVAMTVHDHGAWAPVRSYQLRYEAVPDALPDADVPDRVRLVSLAQCGPPLPDSPGNTGQVPCFPPTRFDWSAGAPGLQPLTGFGLDGVPFYPLPPAKDLETTPYTRAALQVVGDFDADGDADFLVSPECVNGAPDDCSDAHWMYWAMDGQVSKPVETAIPAWSATQWTNRAGTVLPAQGVAKVWNFYADTFELPAPEAVQTGRTRDDKATAGAFAVNYDGSYGTDVLVGEPLVELGGALGDPPNGLGSKTVSRRTPGAEASPQCFVPNGFWTLPWALAQACYEHPAKSKADYTAHPGFMSGLSVLRMTPGTQTFTKTSLHYNDPHPVLWMQPLDWNGDGLSDLVFCQADADYAAVAGQALPMFYGDEANAVNWISGHLHYALNVPGQGIDLSDGGTLTSVTSDAACDARDGYLVTQLYGDGRESLLHYRHPGWGQTQIAQGAPVVPEGTIADPYPYAWGDQLTGYWQKLREWNWAKQPLKQHYDALTYATGQGMSRKATNVPFDSFMRWQQPGNTRARYSTVQASQVDDADGGWDHWNTLHPDDMRDGRLTEWGDPGRPMTGMGDSDIRQGDVNGDGLPDLLAVELANCAYGTDEFDGDAPKFKGRPCNYQDVVEFGSGLLEQTFEKLKVQLYLNRGDGSFAPGQSVNLWDTDMPSAQLWEVLYKQYAGDDYNADLYAQAWAIATSATRGWRAAFASSLMGDGNGDGLADLGIMQLRFEPNGGWLDDSMAGVYRMTPVWHYALSGGGLSRNATPMGIDLDTLVPESAKSGWPGADQAPDNQPDTLWSDSGDAYPSTVTPYEQQTHGLAARLMVMDLTHDGRDELLFYDHVRGTYRIATPAAMAQPQANLLTAVTDGLGARTEVDYAPQWTLGEPGDPWTLADLTLPYPLLSRPSAAPAVSALRTDTGLDAGDSPLFTTTRYLYGKTRMDVMRGASLGIDRRTSTRWVDTPSGPVNSVRAERYDTTSAYDPGLKAYPTAGTLQSETTMVWGAPGTPVAISHAGMAYSGQAGLVPGTWRQQLDTTTASSWQVGNDVPASTVGTLFACLAAALDGAQACSGQALSEQPVSSANTHRVYDDYGYVQLESTVSAGSTTLSQQVFDHHDTLAPNSAYVLGLPSLQWTAHQPRPGFGYTTRTTAHDYNALGQLIRTTVEPDRAAYRSVQTYAYGDGLGHVTSTTRSAQGTADATTSTDYSASGAYPVRVTDAQGHSNTTRWYEGCGVPEQQGDALGHTVVNAIDTFCRDKGARSYFGALPLSRQSTVSYSEWQPNAKEAYPDVEVLITRTIVDGAKTYTIADRVGQVMVNQAPGLKMAVYTQTEHDALGRITRSSLPTPVGQVPTGWTQQRYDARGRLVTLTKPDGSTQHTQYGVLQTKQGIQQTTRSIDELGQVGESRTDALGQVVQVIPPADPKLPGVDLSLCYVYGAFGSLLQAAPCTPTTAKGPTTLTYDDYGRMLSSVDAQAGPRTRVYDRLGRLEMSIDALGQKTKLAYDVLDRVVARTQAFGTPQAKSATWDYDPKSGVLIAATNADQTVVQAPLFDGQNRAVGTATTIHGRKYTQRQSYDGWGRVASQSYPSLSAFDPVITQNKLNAQDQLIGLVAQNQLVWWPDTADAWGHLTHQSYGNGLHAKASYDAQTGRLDQAQVYRLVQQNQDLNFEQQLQGYTYSWTPTGLLERRLQHTSATQPTEQFDQFYYTPRGELDRWTTVGAQQQVKQQAMSYDGFGNIQKSPTGSYAYQGERLEHIDGPLGKLSYQYDGNGQVTARIHPGGVTTLTYDALNQVQAISEPQAKLKITYSADGDKVEVQDTLSGRTTTYLGAYQEERGGPLGTAVIGRYALGPVHLTRTWNPKAQPLSYTDDLRYVTPADHLGSSTLVTTATGHLQEERSYGVWGEERKPADWTAYQAAPKADLESPNSGYTGSHERRRYGAASASGIGGLIDMQARYYDPAAGRFMSPDTLVPEAFNPLSWNRYTYVDNSPVAFSDPTGHAKQAENEIDGAQMIQRNLDDLDAFAGSRGFGAGVISPTGLASGWSADNGEIGDVSATRARWRGVSAGSTAFQWKSEEDGEQRFWRAAYDRDRGNYARAGMKAPFNSIEEYMTWRVMSAEAQAMGLSSQMMEEMANTAEQEQGRFMGGADGAVMGGGKAGLGAMSGAGPKWWWTHKTRAAYEAAQAALAKKGLVKKTEYFIDGIKVSKTTWLRTKVPEGAKVERIDPKGHWVVYKLPDERTKILFQADEALAATTPFNKTNGSSFTSARLTTDGRVYVAEGVHRAVGAANEGANIPTNLGGVADLPGWLSYDFAPWGAPTTGYPVKGMRNPQ